MFKLRTPLLYCRFDLWLSLQDPSHAAFKEKMKEFMANFDKNSDGRIEMSEVRINWIIEK